MSDILKIKELAQDLSVIYVEDEKMIRDNLQRYLQKLFKTVQTASNGKEGLDLYKKNNFDIVITDINMPVMDGYEMCQKIKELHDEQNILVISAYSDAKYFTNFIKLGIDGYILKPIDYNQLNSILFKTCFKIEQFKENKIYKQNLEELLEEKTHSVEDLEQEKVDNYKKTLYALVKMIEDRDSYTGGHSLRVAQYAKLVANQLDFSQERCEVLFQAGILHDIGKIAIPDNILLKPARLEDLEYTIIQEHVNMGVKILEKIPLFKDITKFVEYHHERVDGSGYPKGVKGEDIPLESQILGVCDCFDAMTTNRIYKARKTPKVALEEIKSLGGTHFDKEVTQACYEALKNIKIDESITQLPHTSLEKERFSYFYKDQITQSYNAQYLDLILMQNNQNHTFEYINMIDIHHLNSFNKKYGWQEGNTLLQKLFSLLEQRYKENQIFRIFSDHFILLSKEPLDINIEELQNRLSSDEIELESTVYNLQKEQIHSIYDLEQLHLQDKRD